MSDKPALANDASVSALATSQNRNTTEDLATAELRPGEEIILPVVEETAHVGKRVRETGRVRVDLKTDTTDEILRASLHGNAVGVTCVPIDRVIQEGEPVPQTRVEGSVTIIPVLEEVLVVEKRLVLKEEVHIRETSTNQDVEVPITLRKQRAVIERQGPEGAEPTTSTEELSHEPDDHGPVR
jgi:stress response protein YsnF